MLPLSAQDVLAVWEKGQGQSPLERGLILLNAALPDAGPDALAALAIGERDRLLLELRERSFGPNLKAFAACPRCQERLEYGLRTSELTNNLVPEDEAGGQSGEAVWGEFRLGFRPPTSADLAAAAEAETIDSARMRLLERCVTDARRKGAPVALSELPEDVIAAVGERVAQLDPGGEIVVRLACPKCGHEWTLALEIASFLFAEISVLARRILEEIHSLASGYGWSERDILSLSPARRQFYLDRVR